MPSPACPRMLHPGASDVIKTLALLLLLLLLLSLVHTHAALLLLPLRHTHLVQWAAVCGPCGVGPLRHQPQLRTQRRHILWDNATIDAA